MNNVILYTMNYLDPRGVFCICLESMCYLSCYLFMLPNISFEENKKAFFNRNVNRDLHLWAVWAVRAVREN